MPDFVSNLPEAFSLDDVLLVPQYSEIKSRSEVDLSVNIGKGFKFDLPITPSNMRDIAELNMARAFYNHKALAIFHRFVGFNVQLQWLEEIKSWGTDSLNYIGFSVGVKEEDYINVKGLIKNGAKIILIDVAHGHSKLCGDMTKFISSNFPEVLLISGNVATSEGSNFLFRAGATIVKCNVGSGSLCSTRIMSGSGIPAFSTLQDCYGAKLLCEKNLGRKLFLMQDGGAVNSGNIGKSLCFADLYMGGNIFAGTDEASGKTIELDGKKYKSYAGSSTHKASHKEGIETLKKYQGSVEPIIKQLSEGIRSCCSYSGARNLNELKLKAKFVRITNSGHKESMPHDYDVFVK